VRVDASKSIDPDGRIQQYKWGFGDGATATGRKATHSYDTPGVYRITLTAIDEKGSGDVKSILIRVVDGKEKNVARIGGRLEGPWDRNVYRYRSTLSNPTQVTIKLVGEGGKRDFDLYVTTDGREPTPQNYDNKSVTRDSNETITLKNVRPNQRFGILANSYAGRGAYNVIIEELGQ
jgi:serine protease